jgi:hypothetical protein
MYKNKYLKYKLKYLNLIGGASITINIINPINGTSLFTIAELNSEDTVEKLVQIINGKGLFHFALMNGETVIYNQYNMYDTSEFYKKENPQLNQQISTITNDTSINLSLVVHPDDDFYDILKKYIKKYICIDPEYTDHQDIYDIPNKCLDNFFKLSNLVTYIKQVSCYGSIDRKNAYNYLQNKIRTNDSSIFINGIIESIRTEVRQLPNDDSNMGEIV